MSGEYWAYPELFGLATNLKFLEGGQKRFFQGLENSCYHSPDYKKGHSKLIEDWQYYWNHMENKDYFPMRCVNFCPFAEDCDHDKNILNTCIKTRGRVLQFRKSDMITIEEAEVELKEKFQEAITADDNSIYIIKAPPGIGKSENFLNLKNALIATPRHDLNSELSERMEEAGNECLITPEIPDIGNVMKLYAVGAYSEAKREVHRLAKDGNSDAQKYLAQLKAIENSKETTLITHERLLFSYKKIDRDVILIDEDPFQSLFKIDTVLLNDLEFLKFTLSDVRDKLILQRMIDDIKAAQPNTLYSMRDYVLHKPFVEYEQELSGRLLMNQVKSNVFGFLNCDYYLISENGTVQFIKKRLLPKDKKVIIFSATINEEIYRKMYGDRVKFLDIGNVQPMGKIIQYADRSFSRYQLKDTPNHLNEIKEIIGAKPVITYKKFESEFQNTIATFGALTGLNEFTGKDLNIVGTPHVNMNAYLLYGKALGFSIRPEDYNDVDYQRVKYNGMEFSFNAFSKNPDLRNLQFYLIESELVQAVGRARALRNRCTVTIYSNFPVPGAEYLPLKERLDEIRGGSGEVVWLLCWGKI